MARPTTQQQAPLLSIFGAWRRLWRKPDDPLSDAGFNGELMVAAVRLLILVLLLYLLAAYYANLGTVGGVAGAGLWSLGIGFGAVAVLWSAVNRNWGRAWIGFVSSLLDVTLISGILVLYVFAGVPAATVNDLLVFPAYFLVIAATSLRYDSRVCLLTGLWAVVLYGSIAVWVGWGEAPVGFSWTDQILRIALLGTAAVLSATIVVRAQDLRTLSLRDRFTGLLNRTVFDERLKAEVGYALAVGQSLTVAMIDVDRFKDFNDTHGHGGGDEALRRVSGLLRRSFRDSDHVARYGGDEFAVVLPNVTSVEAGPLVERIRASVSRLQIPVADGQAPVTLTASVGVAVMPDDGSSAEELMRIADGRLYQAKQLGRDRVVGPEPSDGAALRLIDRRRKAGGQAMS